MKIAYITNSINTTTGLERMITVQTDYFVEKYNYNIELILLEQKESETRSFFDLNSSIKLHYLNLPNSKVKFYYKIKRLNHILNKIEADIVMVCVDDVLGLYLPFFIKNKHKTVYQRHATKTINLFRKSGSLKVKVFNYIKKGLIRYGGKGYDKFVILSKEHKREWEHIKSIAVISNPLIIDSTGKKAELENKQVLAVGRHDSVKGFDMLLESWSKVVSSHPDWRLKVIGKRVTSIDLMSIAKDFNIEDTVDFVDYTKDMESAYLDSSILVCSSRSEGFPLVMVEAMSFGVPVVSFDCPYGPRAIINDGEDGILVPVNEIEGLANSIKCLIENDTKRRNFGKHAKINIQRFSKSSIMPQWRGLLEELL